MSGSVRRLDVLDEAPEIAQDSCKLAMNDASWPRDPQGNILKLCPAWVGILRSTALTGGFSPEPICQFLYVT
ncbi:hypothetical protein C8Q80DRAFT_839150 [Daedaleopsis nitida]|nr:hypothetical protein C8Q80DRAFT_839150 [Daedaleopsis nitida]